MNPHHMRRVDPDLAAQNNLPPTWGPKVCTVADCMRPVRSHGLCCKHLYRQARDGTLERSGKDTTRSQVSYAPVAGARTYKTQLRNPCFDPQWEPGYEGPERAREAERLERLIAEVERRRWLRIEERSRYETEADLRTIEQRLRGNAI